MNLSQNYKMITHYHTNSLFLPVMIEFKVTGDYIPMIQLLKAVNLVQTGGEAQIVVEDGEVKYNGQVDYRKRLKVKPGDVVEFRGKKINVT
jgi:ribosome-associated protein